MLTFDATICNGIRLRKYVWLVSVVCSDVDNCGRRYKAIVRGGPRIGEMKGGVAEICRFLFVSLRMTDLHEVHCDDCMRCLGYDTGGHRRYASKSTGAKHTSRTYQMLMDLQIQSTRVDDHSTNLSVILGS